MVGHGSGMDIAKLIRSQGFTVAEAARRANVSRVAIYDLGKPDRNPTMKTLCAVAEAIGVEPSQIIQERKK